MLNGDKVFNDTASKSDFFTIRLTPSQKQLLFELAEERGYRTVSEMIMVLVRKEWELTMTVWAEEFFKDVEPIR